MGGEAMHPMYQIAPLETKQVADAMDMVWRVFSEFEAPQYSQRGIDEFADFIRPEIIKEKQARGELLLWACFDGEAIIGLLALAPRGHISLLFVETAYHRQGVARALWKATQASQKDTCKYTVNASPYAHEAYKHLGFQDTDGEKTVNGLRFIPMQCVIK
jgi:GNAT superfamily N-acetyltransferase